MRFIFIKMNDCWTKKDQWWSFFNERGKKWREKLRMKEGDYQQNKL